VPGKLSPTETNSRASASFDVARRIKLVCCIGVSREEHFARPFLRHFIHHYLGLGIRPEDFLITLHAPQRGEDIAWAEDYLARYAIGIASYLIKEYDCHDFYERDFQLMTTCADDDWIVLVDFDELVEFPESLPHFVEKLEAADFNVVGGHFVDRFAEHYHLAEIKEGPSIWDQFPIQTEFTKDVVGGFTCKICLFRNYLQVNLGHHAVVGTRGPKSRFSHHNLKVHHFKWDSTLTPKLLKRRAQFEADPKRYHWHAEPGRILERINDGRIEFRGT